MFEKMLRDSPDEQWDLFYPVDGDWPSAEQFASYQVLNPPQAHALAQRKPAPKLAAHC